MNRSNNDANGSVAPTSSGLLLLIQHYAVAVFSVGVALGASLLLQHFHFRVPAAPLFLFAVAVSSWYGGTGPAVMSAIMSTISVYWYFVEPVRTVYIYTSEVPYFIIFVAFAALTSWFATIRRRAEAVLREQSNLLSLTHDTIFVTTMEGVIKYWNHGAEERYGWTAEQVLGRNVHDLLKTVFPSPAEEMKAELTRTGRWEGELMHTRKDGTQVVVASRWALQRSKQGPPVAILETNNDITGRKRAEEALRRLNRELRAISNCNQTLLRATDEQSLLQEICRIVCEEAGYRMAWVAYAEHDAAKSVRPVAWTGTEKGYLANLGITWADAERGCGPTGTAIRSGKTCCIQDFAADSRLAPWRESALQHDLRSGIALPLKDEHESVFGSLSIYSAQPHAFTPEETRLLEELAADLAFGIVTLRSRAAREQAEREVALLSFALDKVREAAFLIDDRGCFRYVNEEACRVLGYSRAELLGLCVSDIDPEFPAERWSDHWRDLKAQRSLSFESHHRAQDGRTFPVEVSANYFEYGGRAYNLALVRDITDRKRAEEALRRSEAYLAEGQRLSHTGSWALDVASDKYAYCSEECLRIYGFDPQEGLPTREAVFRRIHPEDRNRVEATFEKALREKVDSSDELRIVLPDGTVKHIHVIRHPVLNDAGELVRLVGTAIDVTERKKAEEALRQSEAYLAESQRLTHTGSWALDVVTREYNYWSEEMFRIFGVDPQGGIPSRETMARRIHPEDWGGALANFEKSLREKVDTSNEYRFVLPGGTTKHIQAIRHPVLNDAGDLVKLVGTFIDVTERKEAEEALRESEGKYHELVEHANSIILHWQRDGRIIHLNEFGQRFFGYTESEICGRHVIGTLVPETESSGRDLQRLMDEICANPSAFEQNVNENMRRNGERVWIAWTNKVLLNLKGEVTEILSIGLDVTDRKRAEEALRRSEAYLAETQRLIQTGSWALDVASWRYVYWSQEMFRIYGFDPQQGLPTREEAFRRLIREDWDRVEASSQRSLREKVDTVDEYRIVLPDGTVKDLRMTRRPVLNDAGDAVQLIGATVDITQRKRAEEEHERLRQLEADLAHMNRVSLMGELAASIAHEVNQPLSGVVSNGSACLRWLGGDVPNVEEAREAARRIVRDGRRAGEVIARVRALAKRVATATEKLDLNETIREVLALVGDEAKRMGVVIRTQFADDLSPVSGDRVQLQQVMLNLVMNAIEAMSGVEERPRELLITTRNIDAEQVQVTVKDSGPGIDPNTLDKIFDPFYTTKPGGMGMGLSISRSILQAHGGRLWAAAKDGPGTIFHFSLPKYQEEESNAAA